MVATWGRQSKNVMITLQLGESRVLIVVIPAVNDSIEAHPEYSIYSEQGKLNHRAAPCLDPEYCSSLIQGRQGCREFFAWARDGEKT